MIFVGEYEVAFTAPGRIILPKKLRKVVRGDVIVLSQGFNNCLAGYDAETWEEGIKNTLDASPFNEENLGKKRLLFSSAVYVDIDEQGRFVIPKNLLQYASLTGENTIVGVGDRFEIWNSRMWREYLENVNN